MIDQGKKSLFGIGVSAIDYEAAVQHIVNAAQQRRPLAISATAVHGLMTAVMDAHQRYRLNHFDLVVPDGQPLVWALNILHKAGLRERVYGPQLTLELCRQSAERQIPVYFYGSRPEVLERMTANLRQRFPALIVAGVSPSLFRTTTLQEKDEICQRIVKSGARIVFVGLGCPRQEVWASEYCQPLSMPTVAVGAAFDFHAGTLAQAPAWMQARGLEWLFRLMKEPARLWKRYLSTNPMFVALFAIQWLLGPRFFPSQGRRPPHELLYG